MSEEKEKKRLWKIIEKAAERASKLDESFMDIEDILLQCEDDPPRKMKAGIAASIRKIDAIIREANKLKKMLA